MANGIVRSTLTDSLIGQLRDDIRSGEIEAGSRLRQSEIADRFNMSTTPVREAFQALEREGLLVSYPHRGVIVFKPTVDDLVETYDIRIPLEAMATEKAVPNMTDEDIDKLAGILKEMEACQEDEASYRKLNTEFHRTIYHPSHRPKLEKLIADWREASSAYLRFYAAIMRTAEQLHQEHTEIFEACQARAPKRAAKAVQRHLEHTVDHVSAALREVEKRD